MTTNQTPAASPARSNSWRRLADWTPALVALAFLAGALEFGRRNDWRMPRASAIAGAAGKESDDWCSEHNVPESICVECGSDKKPINWCRRHGVHDCALCNPELAQTPTPPTVTEADREVADRALAFSSRVDNSKKCKVPERRLQFSSSDLAAKLGVTVETATRGSVSESVEAPAELGYDPSSVARVSARADGVVVDVFANVGDRVRAGQILALVDAQDVGKAKSELLQAVVEERLRAATLQTLREASGSVAGARLQEAEAALEDSKVRALMAAQGLANLGLPIDGLRGASPEALSERLRDLGIPADLSSSRAVAGSSNLLAVRAPLDGEIVSRTAVNGETTDRSRPMFVVADTRRLWLSVAAGSEDASRVRLKQKVYFRHEGHEAGDAATVAWISPVADERTRTVPIRAEFANPDRRHRAGEFGSARIVLREEPRALLVPSEAVHWEGDCNVVFVRDRDYEKDGVKKVFHVRQVRPAAKDMINGRAVTEIAGGLAPGEWVAVANSGLFRSELLKNNLGAG